jgi:hypothetical protein
MTLKEALADWTDWDVAAHALGVCLGAFPEGSKSMDYKAVTWTPGLGDRLHRILLELAFSGVLEQRDETEIQFRWRPYPAADSGAEPVCRLLIQPPGPDYPLL